MRIKNSLILSLVGSGLEATTAYDIPAADAYKAFRFKDGVIKAGKAVNEKREKLVKEAGIDDPEKFDARLKELREMTEQTQGQVKEFAELNAKFEKFQNLWRELMDDETEVEGIKTMSYENFHALAKENRKTIVQIPTGEKDKDGNPKYGSVPIDIFNRFASDLEGILWEAPKDE